MVFLSIPLTLWACVIAAAIPPLFLVIGVVWILYEIRFSRRTSATEGVVIDLHRKVRRSVYFPIAQFQRVEATLDEEDVVFKSRFGSNPPPHRIGDRVPVLYGTKEFDMDTANYPPPVDKLLTYGDCRDLEKKLHKWPDYLELGLGSEHIPDLIRMATDDELLWAYEDTLEVWAPTHAWRTLGQLHAEAAIEPLLSLFEKAEDDDWVTDELPEVYGMIGPAAIPTIIACVADESYTEHARISAIGCLEKIGKMHSDARTECVTALTRQLESFEENDPEFNGFLINGLIELNALEALPVIKRAFDAECVDPIVVGEWDDVQVEFGLKAPEEEDLVEWGFKNLSHLVTWPTRDTEIASPDLSRVKTAHKDPAALKKTKQKMVKQSRKKNRKRR